MSNMPRTLPGAGPWWEARASLAFVERNLYLVRRYWHLELAFLVFNVASAMSVSTFSRSARAMNNNRHGRQMSWRMTSERWPARVPPPSKRLARRTSIVRKK